MEVKKYNTFNKRILALIVVLHVFVFFIHIETKHHQTSRTQVESQSLTVYLETQSKRRQIVESQRSEDRREDAEAKFLSEFTQSFDRQSVARETGTFQEAGQGRTDGSEADQSVSQQQEESSQQQQQKKIDWSKLASAHQQSSQEIKKQRQAHTNARGLEAVSADHSGLAQSSDFIEDIPLGDMTQLNTVEYKYYGFYHRIRQQLEQYWGNTLREKAAQIYAQGRRLPASNHLITALVVTLDEDGRIVEIHVKTPSGISEFDDAAIESFGKAGPFPNPPRGLLQNGRAQIEWGFVIRG